MKSQIFQPHPLLRPYIKYYMYFEVGVSGEWTRGGTSPAAQPLLSCALQTDQIIYKRQGRREPLMFTSQFTHYTPMTVFGKTRAFNTFFQPAGAFQLLNIPQKGLNDRIINFSDLLGSAARRLNEKLADHTTIEGVYKEVESFFLKRLVMQKRYKSASELAYMINQISLKSHQKNIIKEICSQQGYSISRLERHMHEIVGLSPKLLHRIVRFNNVLKYIKQSTSPGNWAQVAYLYGYYDQMHLIKDFSFFHGTTPGRLGTVASKLQLSVGISGEDRSAASIFRVYK